MNMRDVLRAVIPLEIRRIIWRKLHRSGLSLSRDQLHRARDLHNAWRLEEAITAIDLLTRREPDLAPAKFVKADILIDLGRHEDAAAVLYELLQNDPLNVEAINQLKSIGRQVKVSPDVVGDQLRTRPITPALYLSAVKYLNAWSFFSNAKDLAYEALDHFGATAPEHISDGLLAQISFSYERMGLLDEAIDVLRRVKGKGARKAAKESMARCEMERGNATLGAAILGFPVLWHGETVPYHRTLLPILYAMDEIRLAHLSYRTRRSSILVANTFGMTAPSQIDIKSGKYRSQDALILAEGGPGDEIRIASAFRQLLPYFNKLRITCDPRLEAIFARTFPEIEFIPVARHRQQFRSEQTTDRLNLPHRAFSSFVNDAAMDIGRRSGFVCAALDILGEFRATRDDFRAAPARLVAAPPPADLVPVKSSKLRVGIAWRSLLRSNTRDVHYLEAEELAPLASVPNAEFWLLQSGVTPEEQLDLDRVLPGTRSFHGLDIKDDLDGLASAISTLDVVVSPGTNIVELAGMLDIPTILLSTSHATSWRRNEDGSDVWFQRGKVMFAEPIENRKVLMELVALDLTERANARTS